MGVGSSKQKNWGISDGQPMPHIPPLDESSYSTACGVRSNSSSWIGDQEPYDQDPSSYAPKNTHPSQDYGGGRATGDRNKLEIRGGDCNSPEQMTENLTDSGLESSNLIIGIDFTISNEFTGARSFKRQSLHHIGDTLNPYEQVISITGKTFSAFREVNLIHCFGFGDASTQDEDVFAFYEDGKNCEGFDEVLSRYREIVPHLRPAGPTSFAPIIEMATTIVEESGSQHHVLLVIADGQMTRSVDTDNDKPSPQEQKTVDAIVEASKFPLSIILVGVGDGAWDMKGFGDKIPVRNFDNFQFVNFTEIMSKNLPQSLKEAEFALAALTKIPSQYKAAIELNKQGHKVNSPQRAPLPPPLYGAASASNLKRFRTSSFGPSGLVDAASSTNLKCSRTSSFGPSVLDGAAASSNLEHSRTSSFEPSAPYYGDSMPVSTAPPSTGSTHELQLCPICFSKPMDMAFGCGHQTCCGCGEKLDTCTICRTPIELRIKLR